MSSPQAGWYQDPQNRQLQRYWDGSQWTTHTQPIAPPPPPYVASSPASAGSYQVQSPVQQGSYAAAPVSFLDAAKGLITKWSFRGRASRSEYWYAFLSLSLLNIILNIVTGSLSLLNIILYIVAEVVGGDAVVGVGALVSVSSLVQFSLGIKLLLIAIRRYHDIGRSGWWILLQVGLIIGSVIAVFLKALSQSFPSADAPPLPGIWIMLVLCIVCFVWHIVWLCLPGKSERNRFDD